MRVRQFTAAAAGKALPAVVACLLIGAGTAGATVLAADEPTDPGVEQPSGEPSSDESPAEQPPADVPPAEQPPAEIPPTEQPPVVPPPADDAAAAAEATPAAPVTAPPCPADVRNHGAYVSSVARDPANAGPQHGAIVAAAAQSDCGKKPGADDTDADETDTDDTVKSATGQAKKAENAQQRAAKAAAKGKPAKG
jgi:hypothetical protein